jgi:hypothetical protein
MSEPNCSGTCPRCNGSGSLTFTHVRPGEAPVEEVRPCHLCQGSGRVTAQQEAALVLDEVRELRRARGQGAAADPLELPRILAVGLGLPAFLLAISFGRFVGSRLAVLGLRLAAAILLLVGLLWLISWARDSVRRGR